MGCTPQIPALEMKPLEKASEPSSDFLEILVDFPSRFLDEEVIPCVSSLVFFHFCSFFFFSSLSPPLLFLQLKIKKKKLASDQEQLVSKLDKALSLTRRSKLKSPFKFVEGSRGRQKNGGSYNNRYLSPHGALFGKDAKKNLAKSLSFSLKASKEGKNKMAVKMKKLEVGLKMKGRHLKVSNSPAISEVSSYSYGK